MYRRIWKDAVISSFLPILLLTFSNFANASQIINNETIGTSLSLKGTDFHPWGSENKLVIKQSSNGSFLKIQGDTGKTPSGFVYQDLNSRGNQLKLSIGEVVKSPSDARISFSFDVKGLFRNYTFVFIIGSSVVNGWHGNLYYKTLRPNSVYDLNLSDIVAENNGLYLLTKGLSIVVEKQARISGIDFAVAIGNSKVT